MRIHSILREKIPLQMRQEVRYVQRLIKDRIAAIQFEKSYRHDLKTSSVTIVQPIVKSAFIENKIKNITRGCELLTESAIQPNSYWSFWGFLGRPNVHNGFFIGRNLVNGVLSEQVGGGICQLSSMIYHLALIAGVEIIERHPHSVDIYQEHLRFTPLGADSTVVWGSKDLRLHNPFHFPISFSLYVQGAQLVGEIKSDRLIPKKSVEFRREVLDAKVNRVKTCVEGKVLFINDYLHCPV